MRGRPGVGGRGPREIKNVKLDIACKHLARRRMTSSPSTRVREVGQGVTKKGVEFRIRQQTDFRVICTVVLLIQLSTRKSTQLYYMNEKLHEVSGAHVEELIKKFPFLPHG